jgi:beta-glucanase (GH16 family)
MRLMFLLCALAHIASPQSPAPSPSAWKLIWSDEFDGPANTPPDSSKWVYNLGHDGDGWGNKELQAYTNSLENVHQDGQGHLIIRARKDKSGSYTSARLTTKGKFTTQYGKIEARVKLAAARGSGRPFGPWGLTSAPLAGPSAARSTSWRTSAASTASSTPACTDQAIRAPNR